ncbi:MAG: DUF3467 domain-containing protein [Bacteroidales bacterium]|nr:DUF3467 domain-containing protein [Bacteroidales bacterium]
MENNQKNQLNIELTDEIAEGKYSNLAIITHSPTEFIIDFAQVMPGTPKAKVRSRVVLTPQHAKRLYKALADNLAKYESQFGTIKEIGDTIPFAMGGPTAQA